MKKCPQCGISIEDDIYLCGYCQSDLTGDKKSLSVPDQSGIGLQQKVGVKRVRSGSYVYVLTNSSMPGLVKIGYTDIDPHTRASQLSNTNVPTPFKVYGYVEVNYPKEVEKAVHKKLAKYRKHRSREFFRIQPEKAVEVLKNISGQEELKRKYEATKAEKLKSKREVRLLLKRQQEATKAEKLKREREAYYLLKYEREDAEAARLKREKEARNKQEQLKEQVFEEFDAVTEELKKGTNIKLYKRLGKHSRILAKIIFIIGLISFIYLETKTTIIIGVSWAAISGIHLILSKIAKEKLEFFTINVCDNMEERFGQSWHPYKETCILLIYNKLNLGE